VTAADRAAETAMRTPDPGRAFLITASSARNLATNATDAEYCWVLDPIDGTKSFIAGMPAWGTLIALTRGGRAGVRHDAPAVHARALHRRQQRRRAYAGTGRRPRRCRSGAARKLGDALLMTTSPLLMKVATAKELRKVEKAVRLSRYGATATTYCIPGGGHVDLVSNRAQALRHPAS
jgi:myo-inositol-1(or 4)-monophosphatase